MEIENVKLREMVKHTESKILDLLGEVDLPSVNEAIYNIKDDDIEVYDTIMELLFERKRLLDRMFHGTDDEYKRLRDVNSLLRDKTFEIDEISSDTHKYWVENNDGWLKDVDIRVHLMLPDEHVKIEVSDDEREFYGSDFESMINLESVVGMLSFHNLEVSMADSISRINASDLNRDVDDWKTSHLQWLDKTKAGKWCHATHCLEESMHFPIIDIIHLRELEIKLEMNVSCKTEVNVSHI